MAGDKSPLHSLTAVLDFECSRVTGKKPAVWRVLTLWFADISGIIPLGMAGPNASCNVERRKTAMSCLWSPRPHADLSQESRNASGDQSILDRIPLLKRPYLSSSGRRCGRRGNGQNLGQLPATLGV